MAEQKLAVKPCSEIAVRVEQRDRVGREYQTQAQKQSALTANSPQDRYDRRDPGMAAAPQNEDCRNHITDRDALQHSVKAQGRDVIVIGKTIQKYAQRQQNQAPPEDMTNQLGAGCATFQARPEQKKPSTPRR